jgi:4-hydroxy-3-methylbut-2-en-1-yl diphosphate synthase IspG/GcpE
MERAVIRLHRMRAVVVGDIVVRGSAPVVAQSVTRTDVRTADPERKIVEIHAAR